MYRILNVRQTPGDDFKVWFTDDYWDLFIWVDRKKTVSAFQLSYDKSGSEKIIKWQRGGEVYAMTVSSGDENLSANRTPIMVRSTGFNKKQVVEKFLQDSKRVPRPIAGFIKSKLMAAK